jgi:long-subunit fatty acid transport protein
VPGILFPQSVSTSRAALLAFALASATLPALASPLDDPHVGDAGFSGPTAGDLGAVYWNPAALGLLHGAELTFSGSLQQSTVTVARDPIDPATGTSPGALAFPSVKGQGTLYPARWPLGPGGFFAVGAGLERRFAIAFALYSPFSSRLAFPTSAAGPEPTRFHLRRVAIDHTAMAAGLAIHATESLQLGVTAGILFPDISFDFDEDLGPAGDCGGAPCDAGNPAAARLHVGSKGLQPFSYFFTGGLLIHHGRLTLALAYTSAPHGGGDGITIPLDHTSVTWPDGSTSGTCPTNTLCPSPASQMTYRLPGILTLGGGWQLSPRWAASGMLRYLRTGEHDRITLRILGVQSPTGLSLPESIVLGRGFQDAWDLRARLVFQPHARLRISGSFRVETSAVPKDRVNPAAVDGLSLEPSVGAEFTFWRKFKLAASYAFLTMVPVTTGPSAFHPGSAGACDQAAGELTNPACQDRLRGWARADAAGTYRLFRHTLNLQARMGF